MGFLKEFKDFAMRGNMIDLAVGVVIGGAFSKIISSFVANIIMPPLNLLTARSGVNFTELAVKFRTEAPKVKPDGITIERNADGSPVLEMQDYAILNYGPFIQGIIDFLLMAFAVFLALKLINTARKRFEKQKDVEPPPPASEEILLLREIRDSLARQAPRRVE